MSTDKRFLARMYELDETAGADEVRAIYEEWAEAYDEELVAEHGYAMPARAASVMARFSEDKSAPVLDIGCGTGLSGVALKNAGFATIDGCDLSPGMLAKAQMTGVYQRLFEANLVEPPIDVADAQYTQITVVGAFSYGHLDANAVHEVLRPLKTSGVVVLTTNDHFYADGTLAAKLKEVESAGLVETLLSKHGAHIPGKDIEGWVFGLRKLAE